MGTGLIIPLLPFYAQSFGASALEVGLLLGLYPLMRLFAPTFWGSLSDRIGARTALLFNIGGTTLAYLWFSTANSLWMLFMARILGGLSSASMVIAQTYVLSVTTTENRTKTLGYLQAAARIGLVIGPAVGGLLAGNDPTPFSLRLPNIVATLTSGLTFAIAFLALPHITHPPITTADKLLKFSPRTFVANVKDTFQRPLMGSLMTLVFVLFFSGMGIQAIFPLWYEQRLGWGPQQFSFVILYYCLAMAIVQVGLTGRLARWLGETRLFLLSTIVFAIGLSLIPFVHNVYQLLVVLLFLVFAQATGNPSLVNLLSQLSGAKQQGKTLGLKQSMTGLANCMGAIWAGLLFGTLGENWPFWSSAILMAICFLFGWQKITRSQLSGVMRRRRQQKLMYLFDMLDHDKSGTLEIQDFQQVGQDLAQLRGLKPGTEEYDVLQVSFTGFGELLEQLADQDGDRKIDREEWLYCLEQRIDHDFANIFLQVIDTNQDGELSIEELKTFYQVYGISTDELEESFQTIDLNQDGHISKEEFEKIFNQFLYSEDIQDPGNWFFGSSLALRL